MNFGRGWGIPANRPLAKESGGPKLLFYSTLRRTFFPKVGSKQGWQCHKAGCSGSRTADILIREGRSRNSGPYEAEFTRTC